MWRRLPGCSRAIAAYGITQRAANDVSPSPVAPSPKILVPAKTFRAVAANLTDAKVRARFMVIASTLASALRS
jgi:hypothetical protein